MNRRGFIGAVSAIIAAPAVAAVTPVAAPPPVAPLPVAPPPVAPLVMRANGSTIVGIAMETVHVGDFVQIQTRGPVTANARSLTR